MSTNERVSQTTNRLRMFSTQEFMAFLNHQADNIAELEVTVRTKSGLSASFTPSIGKDDVFKSLEIVKTFLSEESVVKSASEVSAPSQSIDLFASNDWSVEYARNHVDVTYNRCFTDSTAVRNPVPSAMETSSLPPKKRTGKTNWNAMYNSALSPLIEAAARAQPQPIEQTTADRGHSIDSTDLPTNSNVILDKKRKPRKIIPTKMEYVDDCADQGK